jgi:membrane-bound lytic murein transglycosylase D
MLKKLFSPNFDLSIHPADLLVRYLKLPNLVLSLSFSTLLLVAFSAAAQEGQPGPGEYDNPVPIIPPPSPTPVVPVLPSSSPAGETPTVDLPPVVPPTAPALFVPAVPGPPVPLLEPKEIQVEVRQADLWTRIRKGFKMPDLQSPLVADRQAWYAARPDYMQRMTERSSRYLYFIVEALEQRGMPMELALLPFIESAFNPQAMSTAKASGMWQFIPSTGKDFKLTQNMWKDERRSVTESTRAALDYFEKLYGMFGDWHLALASYNWGEGSVSRAVAKNLKEGRDADYLSLNMPNETRYYIPKLQAIKNLIAAPEANNITLPDIPNQPYFVTITKLRDIDVSTAAKMADMPLEQFRALNPAFNRPVILGVSKPEILLPADKVELFLANLEASNGKPLSSWMAYTLGKTEPLTRVAERFGISEPSLREVNKIPSGVRIKPGSTLLVPRPHNVTADISEHVAENAELLMEPDRATTRRIAYTVRKGDSIGAIAKRHGVTLVQLRAWNGGKTNFTVGQRVTIQTKVAGHSAAKTKRGLVKVKSPRGVPRAAIHKSKRSVR